MLLEFFDLDSLFLWEKIGVKTSTNIRTKMRKVKNTKWR